jgi:hypothetical protein
MLHFRRDQIHFVFGNIRSFIQAAGEKLAAFFVGGEEAIFQKVKQGFRSTILEET